MASSLLVAPILISVNLNLKRIFPLLFFLACFTLLVLKCLQFRLQSLTSSRCWFLSLTNFSHSRPNGVFLGVSIMFRNPKMVFGFYQVMLSSAQNAGEGHPGKALL